MVGNAHEAETTIDAQRERADAAEQASAAAVDEATRLASELMAAGGVCALDVLAFGGAVVPSVSPFFVVMASI